MTNFYSHAFSLDTGLFYFTDAFTAASDASNSRTFIDVAATINIDKKGFYIVGWSYGILQATDESSSEVTYSLTEMGPIFGYYFDRAKAWPILLVYNLQATADYDTGSGSSQSLRGTSYRASFGYRPLISESLHIGMFLNYHTASFSESLVGSSTFSTVSYSRAVIYPSLTISYDFSK